jgi:hypothetical protein
MAAAAAQFQDLANGSRRQAERLYREGGLLRVLLRRGDERPPRRQVLVKAMTGWHLSHKIILDR